MKNGVKQIRDKEIERLICRYKCRDAALRSGLSGDRARTVLRRAREFGRRVYYRKDAERLMPCAKEAIAAADYGGKALPSGFVWMAESLGGAKGRMERSWWAPRGGLYFTMEMFPSLLPEHWSFYNLGAGVAVAQVLRSWGVAARLRWINDVLLDGLKVAGVLMEAFAAPVSGETYLLVGVGLNVNISSFPQDLPLATSLCRHTDRQWPLIPLAAHVIARTGWIFALLHQWESDFLQSDRDPSDYAENPVIRAWNLLSDTPGRRVAYGIDADLAPELHAVAGGITADGSLRLVLEDGEEITVNTGEVRYDPA